MGFKPRSIKAFDEEGLRALNEMLQELDRGISNANIQGGADIDFDKLHARDLGYRDLTTSEMAIPHGLKEPPILVHWRPTSAITIYESRTSDKFFIYLTASASGRARIVVAS